LIGAYHSHFVNPNGLSRPGHYSTAFDLACIARYALANPIFAAIVNTKETNIEWLDRKGKEHDKNIRNTNKLLWMLEEADGVKTGTTNEAGPCLVSSATRDNQRLIAVVLNDPARWYDSMKLLKYGFDHYDLFTYAQQGEIIGTIKVSHGLSEIVEVTATTEASLVVPSENYDAIHVEIELPETIKAPLYEGQKVGEIVFYVHDKAVKTVDLVSTADVEEKTVSRIFFHDFISTLRLLSGWGLL
jgi:D-alanyl-D-alanine carboxypeptidase (penicillin-binding protein 5/6)